jgi:hypothetical protein
MKTIKGQFRNRTFILVTFLILLLFPWCVGAAVLPQQPDEVQGLQIETSLLSSGGFHQTTAIDWALSSELLGVNYFEAGEDWPEFVSSPEPPLNPLGEVQSYVTYSEDSQANIGTISFDKTTGLDTESLAVGQYNVQTERLITFDGIGGGSLLSSEYTTMHNVGNCFILPCTCPFGSAFNISGLLNTSPFCSKIEFGSDLDVSRVAAATSSGIRNVNKQSPTVDSEIGFIWPPIPNADEPAMAHYMVQVTDMGEGQPSQGVVATDLKIQVIESKCPGNLRPGEELNVDESRSVSGDISLFEYLMDYKDGISF